MKSRWGLLLAACACVAVVIAGCRATKPLTSHPAAFHAAKLAEMDAAIARAIATEPMLLLADEPTGNLDTARGREVMELLCRFNREQGLTVVMVTHEAEMAAYANRVARFRDGLVERDEAAGEGG